MFKKISFVLLISAMITSCSPKIGNSMLAKDDKHDKYYQTWDGKIHEFSSMSKSQYFTPNGGDYMIFDGHRIKKTDIRAYQDKKSYNFNRFGAQAKEISLNPMATSDNSKPKILLSSFAERLIKGKISLYFAITAVDEINNTGSRGDYFFQNAEDDQIIPLRTYTLKNVVKNCKQCKSLLEDAEAEYEGMAKWRQKASDSYVATEKKLSKLLVDTIIEFNSH